MDYSFNVQIAKITHSTDEAVFVHRVYYLVLNNEANKRNFHEGKYWTYDSVAALAKVFSFWTSRQIERIIRNCIKFGLIETGNFSDNPCDRRTWYTVSQTVKSIYANGEMDSTEWGNENTQTVETIPPNGEMLYKEQLKDLLEDQLKDERARPPTQKPKTPKKQTVASAQKYGEFDNVLLTDVELDKLRARWPDQQVCAEIEALSTYMKSRGRRYADHYATLLNWLKCDYPPEDKPSSSSGLIEEGWVNAGR